MMNQYTILPRVGCLESFLLVFKKFATIKGRSRRSEFWYFFTLQRLIDITLATLLIVTAKFETKTVYSYLYYYKYPVLNLNPALQIISAIFTLATLIPLVCLMIRRLQDIGKSAVYIAFIFIPLVGLFI